MIGVAQVIGMNPTLRAFFSGARPRQRPRSPPEVERTARSRPGRSRPPPISGRHAALRPVGTWRAPQRKQRHPDSAAPRCWPARIATPAPPDRARPRSDAHRTRSLRAIACDRNRRDHRMSCAPLCHCHRRRRRFRVIRPARCRTGRRSCPRYAALVSFASIGSPSSIGSAGSRDHSFQEPKYIRTSFTPAFFRARNVFEARAPLKQ